MGHGQSVRPNATAPHTPPRACPHPLRCMYTHSRAHRRGPVMWLPPGALHGCCLEGNTTPPTRSHGVRHRATSCLGSLHACPDCVPAQIACMRAQADATGFQTVASNLHIHELRRDTPSHLARPAIESASGSRTQVVVFNNGSGEPRLHIQRVHVGARALQGNQPALTSPILSQPLRSDPLRWQKQQKARRQVMAPADDVMRAVRTRCSCSMLRGWQRRCH